jgi:hypothetical protein
MTVDGAAIRERLLLLDLPSAARVLVEDFRAEMPEAEYAAIAVGVVRALARHGGG